MNAAITKPPREGANLSSTNYDFSKVSEDELKTCCYYEYARESEAIRSKIKTYRQKKWNRKKGIFVFRTADPSSVKPGSEYLSAYGFRRDVFTMLIDCCGFPDEPWQLLPVLERRKICDTHTTLEESILKVDPPMDLRFVKNWKTFDISEFKKGLSLHLGFVMNPTRSGVFYLNPHYNNEEIIEHFRRWLALQLPPSRLSAVESRGRGKNRDALNALGAVRLRYHCKTLTEAQDLVKHLGKNKFELRYGDRTAWNRACNNAVEKFRKVLHLSDDDYPIHHTEGWRK